MRGVLPMAGVVGGVRDGGGDGSEGEAHLLQGH